MFIFQTRSRIENGMMKQIPREVKLLGKTGVEYKGELNAGIDPVLKSNLYTLSTPNKLLKDILIEEQGMVTLDSQFKSINICDISDDYKYLGGKINCAKYIKKMLKYKPKDVYVNRTVLKKYKMSDISEIEFVPSYQKVEY